MGYKKIIIIIFSLFVFSFSFTQTNRALFVAIDKYPPNSGWINYEIHATNDCNLIIPMLRKNGYTDQNITVLINEKATKKAIIQSLDNLFKISGPGDYIYIHFSGHGQQMLDDNGDEPDGLDEAIIPYDAQRRYSEGRYEGQNHLRDDELGLLLDKIRGKTGITGNLTVVLDACHSGTGTREEEDEDVYIRGIAYVFAPENYKTPPKTPGKWKLHLNSGKHLSPISVFGACLENQSNHEHYDKISKKHYGSLSYTFSSLLKEDLSGITYLEFSERLKNKMNKLFNKKDWDQSPYYESTDDGKIFKIGR